MVSSEEPEPENPGKFHLETLFSDRFSYIYFSLLQALYRIEEPWSGTIEIDKIDFKKLSLFDLRSSLAIIPQDPTLFIGV